MKDFPSSERSTVAGVFRNRTLAERAVANLKRDGFDDDQISLVGKDENGYGNNESGTGAATGAAVGAGTAALVSLGMSLGVIPLVGPVLAMGPLAAALLSAVGGLAAGGLLGALVGLGIPEHEAKYYEEEVKAGRFLVTVRADGRSADASTILQQQGAYTHETEVIVQK
jgi:hypothetical protein